MLTPILSIPDWSKNFYCGCYGLDQEASNPARTPNDSLEIDLPEVVINPFAANLAFLQFNN